MFATQFRRRCSVRLNRSSLPAHAIICTSTAAEVHFCQGRLLTSRDLSKIVDDAMTFRCMQWSIAILLGESHVGDVLKSTSGASSIPRATRGHQGCDLQSKLVADKERKMLFNDL